MEVVFVPVKIIRKKHKKPSPPQWFYTPEMSKAYLGALEVIQRHKSIKKGNKKSAT